MALVSHTTENAKKAERKEKRKDRRKERRRAQPNFTDKAGARRTANMLSKRRRQALQKILGTKDKMGLTKVGAQQLKDLVARKTPTASTGDLEPSAAKVMAHLDAELFNNIFASFDARKLGQGPKGKTTENGGKEIGLGGGGEKKLGLAKNEEEDEWEDDDDEGDEMGPVPLTP